MSTKAKTFEITASDGLLKAAGSRTPHLPVDVWDARGMRLMWSGIMGDQVPLRRNKHYVVTTVVPGFGLVSGKLNLLPDATAFTLGAEQESLMAMDVPTAQTRTSSVEAEIEIYSANLLAEEPTLAEVSPPIRFEVGESNTERVPIPTTAGPLCFARLRQTGKQTLNMGLPQSAQEPSTLLIKRTEDGAIDINIEFENPVIDLLLQYASEVRPRQVNILARSGAILDQRADRIGSPMGALVGAYVALRNDAHELEETAKETLLQQLFMQWPDIPDTAVVWAEHNARKGEHEVALDALETLIDRGLPTFSSGIGYALKRLDRYATLADNRLGSVREERIRKLRTRLGVFAAALKLGRLITTFPGENPILWRTMSDGS